MKAALSFQRRGTDRDGERYPITEIKSNVIPRVGDYVRTPGARGLLLVRSVVCEYEADTKLGDRYVVELD